VRRFRPAPRSLNRPVRRGLRRRRGPRFAATGRIKCGGFPWR
jgi:hypothetical protein